jgi:hypothetical protein
VSAQKATAAVGASAKHDAMVAAYDAQQARLVPADDAWANLAQFFKMDPRRELDPLLEKIASYLQPGDTLLDVGGGAGRLSLPLALRCRDVIVIDPSEGMRDVFESTAKDARIENARYVKADWLDPVEIAGDVALVTQVTYFVPKVAPFVEKLQRTTRRRVIVGMRSMPTPNQFAPVFRLLHNEEMAPVPGPQELLPVLEELGIAAELIDAGPASLPVTFKMGQTREEAIQFEVENAGRGGGLKPGGEGRLAGLIDQHFDDLFAKTERGFMRRSMLDSRELLITWETA